MRKIHAATDHPIPAFIEDYHHQQHARYGPQRPGSYHAPLAPRRQYFSSNSIAGAVHDEADYDSDSAWYQSATQRGSAWREEEEEEGIEAGGAGRMGYYPSVTSFEYPVVGGSRASSPTSRRQLPSTTSALHSVGVRGRAQSSYLFRRGQGRRPPATPNHPSTLNIDSLANISQQPVQFHSGSRMHFDDEDAGNINFPKLEPSPSRYFGKIVSNQTDSLM
jgi:hypothetical protein